MAKLQLGVLYGSRSCEHEVSIISALQLMRQADRAKYDVIPVYISQEGSWYTGAPLLDIQSYVPQFDRTLPGITEVLPDVTARSGALLAWEKQGNGLFARERRRIAARLDVIIPVMHGLHGEDGSLQGLLELMDLPYASTGVMGSAVAMDKIMMKQCFRSFGFPVLKDVSILRSTWRKGAVEAIKSVEEALPYPVFVKPANLGSSIGVSRAEDFHSLAEALALAFSYDRRVLIEEAVQAPIELNCAVLGYDDEVIASVVEMPVSQGQILDYEAKYTRGGGAKGMASLSRVVPAPIGDELTARIQALSREVFMALDCKGCVRVDFMLEPSSERLTITEINAIPGSLAFYLWNKSEPQISYPELIDRLVAAAQRAQDEKNENNFAFRSSILEHAVLAGAKGSKGSKA